jgi:hypothetical protein
MFTVVAQIHFVHKCIPVIFEDAYKGANFPASLITTVFLFSLLQILQASSEASLLYISYPIRVIYQSSTLTMAPTETAGPQSTSTSSPNQSSSEQPKSTKVDVKPEEAQSETDPSTAGFLEQTVSGSGGLTDPAMEEILRVTT